MSVPSGSRQLLIHGMVLVQATSLLALPHSVGLKSVWVMVAAARADHRLVVAGHRVLKARFQYNRNGCVRPPKSNQAKCAAHRFDQG